MEQFNEDDRVRVDIPDTTDPDFDRYHGQKGRIVDVLHDNAGVETGDQRDNTLYRVRLEDEGVADFRWRDLRPVNE